MSQAQTASTSIYKIISFVSIITSLIFCILLLGLLIYLPLPSLMSYLGYADSVVLANADTIDDAFTSQIVGELVKSGTLVSLKDVWSFQTGFYQTIITFLIAINGLIAAIAVIYIKSTSEEKAEETTKRYMRGDTFVHMLNAKVKAEAEEKLKIAQSDFTSTAELFENSVASINEAFERLELLENENQTLRQQFKVVSERVSKLDTLEEDGKDARLVKKEK